MKSYKLKKSELTKVNYAGILRRVGAVDGNQAYPSHTYISSKTAKRMERALYAAYKKEFPWAHNKKLQYSVGMEILNLEPSICDAIKDGYIAVDDRAINDILGTKEESKTLLTDS